MKRLARLFLSLLAAVVMLTVETSAQNGTSTTLMELKRPSENMLNINNLWLKVRNDGVIGYDSLDGKGLTYPMMLGNLLYCDDLIWVGKVKDDRLPELRTGGGRYHAGVVPGAVLSKGVAEDAQSPAVRVYRIRSDYPTADLTLDAAGYFGVDRTKVTSEMVATLRAQYEKDWNEWPWQKGAPFVDKNGNGVLDGNEKPGLQGADQVIWFAYNDLDESVCKGFVGAPSIGLEVQVTLWAYKDVPNFQDVIFKRYQLIYKGTSLTPSNAVVDSMYLSQWADPDIGNPFDDLAGCDSTLSLAFAFSSTNPDQVYKTLGANPGIGYALLQGPLVPGGQSDEGVFDFKVQKGAKNLPMTSFLLNSTGDFISEPPYGLYNYWYWNVVRGFVPEPQDKPGSRPWINPDGTVTKFMDAGDPVARSGWIDGTGAYWSNTVGDGISVFPSDRRFMLNTGPFTMTLGDKQEVVIAIIASAAPDGPQNSIYLKNRTKYLQAIYPDLEGYVSSFRQVTSVPSSTIPLEFSLEQNFPNPFNPSTQIGYTVPSDGYVKLALYDLLGREIRILQDDVQIRGRHIVSWDGRDASNALAPSAVYFYSLTQGQLQQTRKLLVVR